MRDGFEIFGDDYDTPDGTCVRDYIHVSDLADAHLLAVRYLEGGGRSATLNLGNERGFSVREVAEAMQKVSGREFPVRIGPRRPGDPARLVSSAARARDGTQTAFPHNPDALSHGEGRGTLYDSCDRAGVMLIVFRACRRSTSALRASARSSNFRRS